MKPVYIKMLVVIVLLAALFGIMQWSDMVRNNQPRDRGADNKPDEGYFPEQIEARHVYRDGTHTLTGTVALPTPCHGLKTDSVVRESLPEQVVIWFTITEPEGDVVCIQMIDERKFELEFDVSENASFEATVNDRPVELKLIKE